MRFINRVPGGLMVVPLFLGIILNTIKPDLLLIGSFTEGLGKAGFPTIIGMYLFCAGCKITLKAAPRILRRGFGILFAKVATAMLLALLVARLFDGNVFGLSTLAVMVAFSDTNGGMFMALTSVMGDKDDAGTYVPQSIETGPFLTMIFLVGAGLANIPWLSMVSVLVPIIAGTLLGNLDEELRQFFGKHESVIVPFMAFALGQNINLMNVVNAGPAGIALGVLVCAITGAVCITADRLLGGSGIAGAAASSTAGNSAAVPKAIAIADPTYTALVPIATAQVAASIIMTAILTPLLTSFVHGIVHRGRARAGKSAAVVEPVSP